MSIQTPSNESDSRPHFVLVPLMAHGHMIPMTDLACLLASRGSIVTYVTTPLNAARISTVISHAEHSQAPIRFVQLPFPAVESGLPEATENVDMLPSLDLLKNFVDAACSLRDPLVLHLRTSHPSPTCVISDSIHYWTQNVALELGIPRLVFHGFGCFPLLCIRNMQTHKIEETVRDVNEPFLIPGLPPGSAIEITRAQVPVSFAVPSMREHQEGMKEAEATSAGAVVNTFDELEPSYLEWYQKALGKKVWTVGPLSLSSTDVAGTAARGNKASISEDRCLRWLDSMAPISVVFVSFGSLVRTIPAQLVEIGSGLEDSGRPFIWVVKTGEAFAEVEGWLSEFEQRNKERGLVIRGWAPQVMILSHAAVGGFMTHCGWNSTLEAVALGVPLITWPHFGDQFLNEKLVVEVLRTGVAVGVKDPVPWGVETNEVLVKKGDVERAVRRLLDEGEEAEERRKRAKELGRKAQKAVEAGGSSYSNLTELILQMCAK